MFNQVATQLLQIIADELSAPTVVFPTSFDVTLRVQKLLKSPDFALDQLVEPISAEPLMSTRILSYANSAAVRGSGPEMTDLRTAIMRIGLEAVRSIAYSVAVEQLVRSRHMAPFRELSNRIWEHSLAVAIVARALAKEARLNGDKAFFMGVVHDIGAFYLLFRGSQNETLAADHDALLQLVFEWHDGIGHALLSAMGQADDILLAVQDHEAERPITSLEDWTDILAVADRLGQELADWVPPELRAQYPCRIDDSILTPERREALIAQAREEMATLRASLF